MAAVKQYVDLMAKDKIIAPGNAEYDKNQSLQDFANGKTAMVLWQSAASSFKAHGMKEGDWGVAPVPVPAGGTPGAGRNVNSMVAGINLAVFKNTDNLDGALKFVEFMTGDEEQKLLNATYGSIPRSRPPRAIRPSPERTRPCSGPPSPPAPPRSRRFPRSRSSRRRSAPPSRNSSPTPRPESR